MSNKGYRFAGDVEIKSINLVLSGGRSLDISDMILEVNIYQNMFEHYLRGNFVVEDALNLNNIIKGNKEAGIAGGFNGGEYIIISYRERTDPGYKGIAYKQHMFALYETSNRRRISEFNESYMLSGISAEAYQTIPQKINKAYGRGSGSTISKMIKSIVDEYVLTNDIKTIYRSARINKSLDIDETSGLHKYIIPSLSIDGSINFLANEADSIDHYPYYIFFEDSSGFKFKNVPQMIADAPIDFTYTYFMSNVGESDTKEGVVQDDQYKIISYDILKDDNILSNVKGGLFKAKTINLDILKKNKKEVIFDYNKESDNFQTVSDGKFAVEVVGDPVINLISSRTGHDNDVLFQKETALPKKTNTTLNRKLSYGKQLFNKIIQVSIPGNSSINVGGLIDLEFFIHNNIGTDKGNLDKSLSGQYLITKVRQKITNDVFTTILECARTTNSL